MVTVLSSIVPRCAPPDLQVRLDLGLEVSLLLSHKGLTGGIELFGNDTSVIFPLGDESLVSRLWVRVRGG